MLLLAGLRKLLLLFNALFSELELVLLKPRNLLIIKLIEELIHKFLFLGNF